MYILVDTKSFKCKIITLCACTNVPKVCNGGQSSIVTSQFANNDLTTQHQKENVAIFDIRPAKTEITNQMNNVPLPGTASWGYRQHECRGMSSPKLNMITFMLCESTVGIYNRPVVLVR